MAYRIEKNADGNPEIVFGGWGDGIADSPHLGLQDVRCVNVEDAPGVFFTQPETTVTAVAPNSQTTSFSGFAKTFTANAGTDIITFSTYPNSIAADAIAVTFTSTGTLPAPLVAGTVYYLIYQTATTFKVATSLANALAGTAIDITDAGTGTHTCTSVNMGNMTTATIDPRTSMILTQDSNGRVWYSTGSGWVLLFGNTLTSSTGNGIVVFGDWLFVFRNRSIDVYGQLALGISAGTWYNGWKTMNASVAYTNRHDLLIGQDETLYWTDYDDATAYNTRGYIGSLRAVAGQLLFQDTGNPTTSNSTTNYTYNNQALDLPLYEEPVALEELGSSLVIGVNGYIYGFTKGYSKIYTWDRISPSFGNPLFVPDFPIKELINYNNVIYIFAGTRGIIYRTNLTSVEKAKKVPDSMFVPNSASEIEGNPLRSSDTMTFSSNVAVARNKIFFGLGNLDGGSGLYSYNPDKDILVLENRCSVASYGTNTLPVTIPCVISPGSALVVYFSFSHNSVYGWDQAVPTGTTDSANTFYSYVITDWVPVATKIGKRNFAEVEWKLDTALGDSDAVRISYRKVNDSSFTTINSTSYSSGLAPQISDIYDANIENAEFLQFKIETSSTNSNGSSGVRFRELRVR